MTNATYHYPPDLFQLLVNAIPRLCKSKRDVLLFFRGAGVADNVTADLTAQLAQDRDSITKFEIVRTVLSRLNETGDLTLRERREVLKRVVEFEDFSTCWPDDRLEAQGLVAQIRQVVNVKDSFTRMQQERAEEARKHREHHRNEIEGIQQRQAVLKEIYHDLCSLFTMNNAQKKGLMLEKVLNRLFEATGILIRENFRRTEELGQGVIDQIDGVIELDGNVYLVEMKWLKEPAGVADVSQHLVRVFNRGGGRGIFISYSEYTSGAIQICKESLNQAVVILCTLQEFVLLMEMEGNLEELLRQKIHGSIVNKQPLTVVS